MKHGKKYQDSTKLVDTAALYDTTEAIENCLKTAKAKFDETVEIHVRLGVDSRHAEQQVRGAVVLPNGTGKTVRVMVFCKGDKVDAALVLALITLVLKSTCRKSRAAGWTRRCHR